MSEEQVEFTFRFGGGTYMVPRSFAENMAASYRQYDKEQEPGYVKPIPSENSVFRKTLRVGIVDDQDMILIDPSTNKGYEFYHNWRDSDEPVTPIEYTTFKRWASGHDF